MNVSYELETPKSSKYKLLILLGSVIAYIRKCDTGIRRRIGTAKDAVQKLKKKYYETGIFR